MTTVLVSGAIANKPFQGGAAWTRLSWFLGLQKLGFDTYFVEQIEPELLPAGSNYFRHAVDQFGLHGRAALVCEPPGIEGIDWQKMVQIAHAADLLVNISGHLTIPALC